MYHSMIVLVYALLGIVLICFALRTWFPDISGKLYKRVFRFFKQSYKGIMFPVQLLYFFYFPNNAKVRKELAKDQYCYKVLKNGRYVYADHLKTLRHIRFKNIRASALHSPASTLSIILSYIGFMVSIVIYFLPLNTNLFQNPDFWHVLLTASFLLLLPIPVYLRLYILNLPLEEYGSIHRSHLTVSEMLCMTSYKIIELSLAFDEEVAWLFREGLLADSKDNKACYNAEGKFRMPPEMMERMKQNLSRISDCSNRLNRLSVKLQSLERDVQRIGVLIANLAKRLKVPEIELCEHIFQFSPTQFKEQTAKFSSNLQVAIGFISCFPEDLTRSYAGDSLLNSMFDRILSLLYECHRFYRRNQKIIGYQYQNIAYRDLHEAVVGFAAEKSSCEAAKMYTRALSDTFHKYYVSEKKHICTKECFFTKIKYLYHKRKAHVGIDLHFSVFRLMEDMIEKKEMKEWDHDMVEALRAFFDVETFKQTFEKNGGDLDGFIAKTNQVMTKMIQFYTLTIPYIEKCRTKIRGQFEERYLDYFRGMDDGRQLYIITFGYSKVVRDIIKYTIPRMVKSLYGEETIENMERFKVVIFMPEDEGRLDSRAIKYYLTEERQRAYLPVMISDPEFILPLLNDASKILVLMGAETFDAKGRAVRTSMYKNDLCKFLHAAVPIVSGGRSGWDKTDDIKKVDEVKIVVCAEPYKKNLDLSRIERYFDDRYEKVEVYGAHLITEILDGD